jgi:hypothetical protein
MRAAIPSPMRYLAAPSLCLAFALAGCTSPSNDHQTVDDLASQLEAAGADGHAFALGLGDSKSDLDLEALLPSGLREQVHALLDRAVADVKTAAGDAVAAIDPRADQAAVLIVANADERIWVRNLLEWIARLHFDANMRPHYREVAICTGKRATWSCFRQGLADVGTRHATVDLIVQTHGSPGAAYDDEDEPLDAESLFTPIAPIRAQYRFGMFMPCFAGSQNGILETFMAHGGKAAFGSPGISYPFSDLIFEVALGAFGETFGDAISLGNRIEDRGASVVESLTKPWTDEALPDGGPVPKRTVGDLTLTIDG